MAMRLRHACATAGVLALVGYFAVHALTGERGVLAWAETKRHLAAERAALAALQSHHADLADHARRLRDDTLDLDYLDERARALAGMAHKRDVIIPASVLPPSVASGVDAALDHP